MSGKISISAIGDISFENISFQNLNNQIFRNCYPIFKSSDIVIANLESPLILGGLPIVGKCTMRGEPAWVRCMKENSITAVSLANNHLMDYGEEGLITTREALDQSGIIYFGAGNNIEEARKEKCIEIKGKKIALLGRTDVFVASKSYAEKDIPGVAFLDVEETKTRIHYCRQSYDHVILNLHWGLEGYAYPQMKQRLMAKEFIDAGAKLIIGHHPHVLQGIESFDNGIVCYSLGNFIFSEFEWKYRDGEGIDQKDNIKLNPENRRSGILKVQLPNQEGHTYEFIPTVIRADGAVLIDNSMQKKKEIDKLSKFFHWPAYQKLWSLYSLKQEFLLRMIPFFQHGIKWSKLRKFRYKHISRFLDVLKKSGKIISEKSSTPYD